MMKSLESLKGFSLLLLVVLVAPFHWACTSTTSLPTSTTTNNTPGNIPITTLFSPLTGATAGYTGGSASGFGGISAAFQSALNSSSFSSAYPTASAYSSSWMIGMVEQIGVNEVLGGTPISESMGYACVALAVSGGAVTDATVSIANSGVTIPMSYWMSTSASGFNYALYGTGTASTAMAPITLIGNTTTTLSVNSTAGTAVCSMTEPGPVVLTPSGAIVTASATNPGKYDAGLVFGISGTSASLGYLSTSSIGSPFTFPSSAYSMSSPATFMTGYIAADWSTSVTGTAGLKGGMLGVDYGLTQTTK